MKAGKRSVAQRVWSQSAECAAAAERGREQAAAQREAAPKCGAKRKTDGAPCEGLAMPNGRCRLHGGATGAGPGWHQIAWPGPDAPPWKLEKKLRELARREQRRRARVAAMSPDERARYERHREAMRPRSLTAREAARRDREAAGLLKANSPPPESAAQAELRVEYEQLEADLARINAEIAAGAAALQTKESTQ